MHLIALDSDKRQGLLNEWKAGLLAREKLKSPRSQSGSKHVNQGYPSALGKSISQFLLKILAALERNCNHELR